MSKICVLPWIHIATTPTGKLRVCCNAQNSSNFKFNQLEKYKKSDYLETIKQDMLNDKVPNTCKRCFDEENLGIKSARISYNEKFSKYLNDLENAPIVYLDLRLGNSCNLKCRMCNGYSSSFWKDDHKAMYNEETKLYNWDQNQEFFYILKNNLEFVECVYFTGGEPLINPHHIDILNWLIENNKTNVELKYNTNLTIVPEKVIELWKLFSNLKLHLSVDGVENIYEYIRFPGKWNVFLENYEKVKLITNNIKIHCTVQMTNIEHLEDLVKWAEYEIYWNILEKPEYLSITNLPLNKRQILIEKYSDSIYEKIFNYLKNSKEGNYDLFLEYNKKLDLIRKI